MKEYDEELMEVDQRPVALFTTMTELAEDSNTANHRKPEPEPATAKEDAEMADAGRSNPPPPPHQLPPQQDVFPPRTARTPEGLRRP